MKARLFAIVVALFAALARPLDAASQPAPCGLSPTDRCPAPPGDLCGVHRTEASCRTDPQCAGQRYRGESVVACRPDGRGFWSNCPAVDCLSRVPG